MYQFEARNYSYNELMHILDELTKLKQNGTTWTCLLRNHKDPADCFYSQSHGELRLSIKGTKQDYVVTLIIHSIDDGAIVLLGPIESEDKALRRSCYLRDQIKEWGGWIPNTDQVETAARLTGCYWNR